MDKSTNVRPSVYNDTNFVSAAITYSNGQCFPVKLAYSAANYQTINETVQVIISIAKIQHLITTISFKYVHDPPRKYCCD